MSGAERAPRRLLSSARTRIVGWFLLLLVAAENVSVVASRQVLMLRVEEECDRDLAQEVDELRSLAAQIDPQSGEPYGGGRTGCSGRSCRATSPTATRCS